MPNPNHNSNLKLVRHSGVRHSGPFPRKTHSDSLLFALSRSTSVASGNFARMFRSCELCLESLSFLSYTHSRAAVLLILCVETTSQYKKTVYSMMVRYSRNWCSTFVNSIPGRRTIGRLVLDGPAVCRRGFETCGLTYT